jgi:hypothetical protein
MLKGVLEPLDVEIIGAAGVGSIQKWTMMHTV